MIKAEILEVKGENGKSEFRVLLGTHLIGTSKTDFDARFHMHAINDAIAQAYSQGKADLDWWTHYLTRWLGF